ncbi:histidinol-phosphatase HisJ [Paenibacillus sp. JCM 10914]|uniref:histidinol-phosphatase n=1 Tax=Paenibacillus sp. JCM 10914 TaxID=1236974 RepID=UPI0003CC5B02|nr:histidinol-phosphatase [Paenibacillus sp. JCM 10914]GAE08190.1 histidinol-phosphatase [Paenibacillus sp. JCM 10914]
MKFDLHTHHFRCGHADGNIRDYVEAAIAADFQVIGISDHTPYFGSDEEQPFPSISMAKREFDHYVREVLDIKKEYEGKIKVLLGIEADYFPQHAHVYQQALSAHPFDYIIGSIHHVRDVSIFNKNRWNHLTTDEQKADKEEYFNLIRQSARSGMFQIIAHMDAMKGNYPPFSDIVTDEAIDETLRVIAECGLAIEVNTSGKTKLSGGWYPSHAILEVAHHHGVDITFGSDAHKPSRVGDEFDEVAKVLKDIGYNEWVYFEQKQKVTVPLL